MPERLVVQHCAPTLAGLKTASLFTCACVDKETLGQEVTALNEKLMQKGIRVMVLGYKKDRALIYMYRPQQLKKDIGLAETAELLKKHGYETTHMGKCLTRLIQKLQTETTFPHEIGCFLGYPAEDVKGFIQHDKPSKVTGTWRVYGNVEQAMKQFERFNNCTYAYIKQHEAGVHLEQLAVVSSI